MRRLIVLVPLVLIGGYVVLSSADHTHHRTVVMAGAKPVVVHAVDVARAEAAAHEAEALAAHAEQLAAEVQAAASAKASLSVTLDGLVATLRRELARSAETGEPVELQSVQVSAEILAEVAAELESMFEIRSDGAEHLVVSSPDGATVEISIQ